jgi:hypothetical protein
MEVGMGDTTYSGTTGTQESAQNAALVSNFYAASGNFAAKTVSVAADRYKLLSPADGAIKIAGTTYYWPTQQTLDLSQAATWDTTGGTDYRTAANRAGKDFYVYACAPGAGVTTPIFLVSANASAPSGYTTANSRQVGGFHGICVDYGTISNHPLTGYLTGDILPTSVWDLKHRPFASPAGMAYSALADWWFDIYPPSGTGASTASAFAATVTVSLKWSDTCDAFAAVGKSLCDDALFFIASAGSNAQTNIWGSQAPVKTGQIGTSLITGATLTGTTFSRAAFSHASFNQEYEVEIDGNGTPDTFKWRKKTFGGAFGSYTSTIPIVAGPMALADGVTITFPATTGLTIGHKINIYVMDAGFDTSGRRMVSNIGLEGCCGFYSQWLKDTGYYVAAAAHTHQVTVSGDPQTVTSGGPSADPAPTQAWRDPSGGLGKLNTLGAYGEAKLVAGGTYNASTNSGPRSREFCVTRLAASAWQTGRGCSRPMVTM